MPNTQDHTQIQESAMRIKEVTETLTARKTHMYNSQKALLFSLTQHLEAHSDISYVRLAKGIKKAATAHVNAINHVQAHGYKQDLPWAVRTAKGQELCSAINALFPDEIPDLAAKNLQNFVEQHQLPAWSWEDAQNPAFPVLGGELGNNYWGTPNSTYTTGLLMFAHAAVGSDYKKHSHTQVSKDNHDITPLDASVYYSYSLSEPTSKALMSEECQQKTCSLLAQPGSLLTQADHCLELTLPHSGFCFGGAGEAMSDYQSAYPPHDCSSSVSKWFNMPFRISTIDQYVLGAYPRALLSGLHIVNTLPLPKTPFVKKLDSLSFFGGKIQRAQDLAEHLQWVSPQDTQPGDMYVMRIRKPGTKLFSPSTWQNYFFGCAGHTALVTSNIDNSGKVSTIELAREIENGIEGFGTCKRPLYPETRPNGNKVDNFTLRPKLL